MLEICFIFHSDERGTEKSTRVGVWLCEFNLWFSQSPKLRWQQWQGLMANQSIPPMAPTSFTTGILLCVTRVCACEWVGASVCMMRLVIRVAVDMIMETQHQIRQLIARWSEHLNPLLLTAKVSRSTRMSEWRPEKYQQWRNRV